MVTINPFMPSSTLLDRPRLRRSGGLLKKAMSALVHAWRAHLDYKRLSNLSDKALAKRGLTRANLGRYVFFGTKN